MANSKTVGDTSEAKVLARFIELGWGVMIPFGDNLRYDLVLDRGNGLERVQVKTAQYKCGTIRFRSCSQRNRTNIKIKYNGQADIFAIYCAYTGNVYLIDVNETNNYELSLRIESSKNNQSKHIRWASNYAI